MARRCFGQALMILLSVLCKVLYAYALTSDGFENAQTVIGAANLYLNLQCPASLPIPCRGVYSSTDQHVVQTLWDGHQVLCNAQATGGGWLVIQRRFNGQVDFYKNWEEYKHGFGNVTSEFWFGNEKIHRLTGTRHFELRVNLKFKGEDYYAMYSYFRLYGEQEKYKLEISGYSGNAGDSLGRQNNMAFSTKDRDNDQASKSCAQLYHGAWWYEDCHRSNLNGLWGSKDYGMGLSWFYATTYTDSATYTEMMIRPSE